jgi:hypothetical protein
MDAIQVRHPRQGRACARRKLANIDGPRPGCHDEGSAAEDGPDETSLAEDLKRLAHRDVGHLVFLGQVSFGRKPAREFFDGDPPGDVVGELDVGKFASHRVDRRHRHALRLDLHRAYIGLSGYLCSMATGRSVS